MPANAWASPASLTLKDILVQVPEPGGKTTRILELAELSLPPGKSLGVTGPSGAGKSTLIKLVAGLIHPGMGQVLWNGEVLPQGRRRDRWRRETLGLVFQDFALLPKLSALDNVLLPVDFDHWRRPHRFTARALALLERAGIETPLHQAASLSRGEQQRVAVVRALLRQPALLLADEPTASLDAANGEAVADLLFESVHESGAGLMIVSHDERLLARCAAILLLDRGQVVTLDGR